jgi:hypothetical protein
VSFNTYDQSRAGGRPVEIYLFTYGSGPSDYYAYTDHARVVSTGGIDYDPVPIDRGRLQANGGRERRDLTIQMANENPVPNLFIIYPPDSPVMVSIKAGHLDDPAAEFVPVWSGRVVNVKWGEDGVADLVCRPLAAASRQGGLRRHWQIGCPHVLFGSQCLAVEAAATVSVGVTNVSSNKVTLAAGWNAQPVAKYIGGKVSWAFGSNTIRRSILRIESDARTVVLSGPATNLAVGDVADVALGCNRQMDDCLTLHNNIHNFGGDPWIPLVNPVNTNPYV